MNVIIRLAKIIDPTSPHYLKAKDILIEKGVIAKIGSRLPNPKNYKELKSKNLSVSPGWVDMFAFFGDPGFEYKEDLATGTQAAMAGGFTTVCVMPNTHPAVDSKSQVEYVINRTRDSLVNVLPIGAVSHKCEGKDITEIYDMRQAGAVAFSDGVNSSMNAGLMLRGLQYVKPFNGLIISHPDDNSIRNGGVVNEGVMSTSLGLKGIPAIAEELTVMRDINLAQYAGSKVHFAYVSTPESLALIKKARKGGLQVTCSVSPYSLVLEETVLDTYDTNYKVMPPVREKKVAAELLKGLKDGTIDTIASCHIPQDTEAKIVEFDFASFGMLGLQTVYPLLNTHLGEQLSETLLVEKLAINPRKILQMNMPAIKEGIEANLTLFDSSTEWVLEEKDIQSKSKNTPFIGEQFKGKVVGAINNNQLHINP